MFDLKILQKQPDLVAQALEKRGSAIKVDEFLDLDQRRRKALAQVEALKNTRNQQSARVAQLKKAGQNAEELVAELGSLSGQIRNLDQEAEALQEEVNAWLLGVPNMPDASVPVGRSEADNVEVARWGRPRQFDFPVLDHVELGLRTGGLDLERAGKLTGSRFSVSRGMIARLERALANYYLDVQTEEFGHLEILPPFMVNRQTMQGTGQLPKFEEDLFKLAAWDYYLIPTAEVPLTNLHAGETLDEDILPLLYTAATPCFRSEAGSYGKDTRGLIRQHQFTKVEMVHFAHPDKSFAQLETMRSFAETLLQRLELPYRTIVLCTGDMGFASAKTYDVEVWLPAQNTYREISSCSNCTDFQARRANIRFKPKGAAKSELVHTLNGSGLPTGRSLVAVMENYQTADGGVEVPKVLQPYMNGLTKIEPVNL